MRNASGDDSHRGCLLFYECRLWEEHDMPILLYTTIRGSNFNMFGDYNRMLRYEFCINAEDDW